jgi:hypothetical protein
MPTEKGHMELGVLRNIIEQISPYAEIIKLHWIGEPLLHPRLLELIRVVREHSRASIYLSTNATLLHGELAESIRTSGLDKLILSLDGMSVSSYSAVRLRGAFSQVFRNIETFVKAVESRGGPLCEVQMIRTKYNKSEVETFHRKWGAYKHVIVNVTWLTDWAGSIASPETISEARNPVALLPTRSACSDLWFKMQISWSGIVHLCCLDAKGTVRLGSAAQDDLRSMWQSNTIAELRRQQLSKHYAGVCTACRDWAQPQEYDFWYTATQYQNNPNAIWTAPPINLSDTH